MFSSNPVYCMSVIPPQAGSLKPGTGAPPSCWHAGGTWAHRQAHPDVCREHAQSRSPPEPTPAQKDSVSATRLSGICQMFLHNHSKYLICGSQVFDHQLSARIHEGRINHIAHSGLCQQKHHIAVFEEMGIKSFLCEELMVKSLKDGSL